MSLVLFSLKSRLFGCQKYFGYPKNPDLSIKKTNDKKLRRFVLKLFAREGHLLLMQDYKGTQISPKYF